MRDRFGKAAKMKTVELTEEEENFYNNQKDTINKAEKKEEKVTKKEKRNKKTTEKEKRGKKKEKEEK
jgi:hypothetical protein